MMTPLRRARFVRYAVIPTLLVVVCAACGNPSGLGPRSSVAEVEVFGIVTSISDGLPVAGASVSFYRITIDVSPNAISHGGASRITDAEGRYSLVLLLRCYKDRVSMFTRVIADEYRYLTSPFSVEFSCSQTESKRVDIGLHEPL